MTALLFAAGCVDDEREPSTSSTRDSGGDPGSDSGALTDSGANTDSPDSGGNMGADSGMTFDSGASTDSGAVTDAGTTDSGTTDSSTTDAGATIDSGMATDAGPNCYSPTNNLDLAYEPGAVGCECAEQELDRCINGVALMCENGAWQAVEDGACYPRVCAGQIVAEPGLCLQDDAYCDPMPDGSYCTGPAEPQCPVASEPIEQGDDCPANAVCFDYSESLRCKRRLFTPGQCEEAGGAVVDTSSDGGASSVSCADGEIALGGIDSDVQAEGLCCAAALAEECRPQDVHRVGGCEPPARYHWNGLNCVGLSGCSCVGEDCDADFGSMEECESAFDSCQEDVRACGGDQLGGSACGLSEYCAYQPEQECGATDAPAVCVPRPETCTDHYDPVCGCDHEPYANACLAAVAGVGVLNYGDCPQ